MQVRKLILLSFVCALAGGLTACGDMNHALKTTDEVNTKTDHLAKRTDDLERELVNKESNVTLSDMLDSLFGDGKFSGLAVTEATMLQEAGFAVESMHFQYWKGDYNEPMAVLDDFFKQALEVTFTKSSGHIPNNYNPDVFQPDRDFKAVASLASQLDRLRPEYAAVLANTGNKNLSAYDVILEALKGRDSFVRKDRLPKTAAMILHWKQEAIYMLQLRQIYFPVMVLARLSHFEDQADLVSLKFWDTRAWDAFGIGGGGLKIDLATNDPTRKLDPEQLKEYTHWLNQSLETRQALRDMCIPPQSNSTLRKILNNVKLVFPTPQQVASSTPQINTLRNDFYQTYKRAVNDNDSAPLAAGCH